MSRPAVLLVALAGIVPVLLGVATNVATGGKLPGPLESYEAWAWPTVLLLGITSASVTAWQLFRQARDNHDESTTHRDDPVIMQGRQTMDGDIVSSNVAGRDLHQAGPYLNVSGSAIGTLTISQRGPADIPPAGLPTIPAELPADLADFTGRKDVLTELYQHATAKNEQATRIVAIDGVAGAGKSALAIHLAHRLLPQFTDGQLYVDLRGSDAEQLTPHAVLHQFLRALGLPSEEVPADIQTAARQYRSLLANRRVLVVLDNAANAAQVRPLLPGGSACAVFVTSRARLVLEGAVTVTLGLLAEEEAVELMARLAGRARIAAEPEVSVAVVHYCGLLPLAVRIAGARLAKRPTWAVMDLAARLTDAHGRLKELTVGDLAVRVSFQISYQELRRAEARVFRLLGLLDGPDFTARTAAALTGLSLMKAERILEQLVDVQLLGQPSVGRYLFHDLLRCFARERMEDEELPENRETALVSVLNWYVIQTEQATDMLRPGAYRSTSAHDGEFGDRITALAWLEVERANLVAATDQAARNASNQSGGLETAYVAMRLAKALYGFFDLCKHWTDWQVTSEAALRTVRLVGDRREEALILGSLSTVFIQTSRLDEAVACLKQSQEICQELRALSLCESVWFVT